jgi:4-aminobutyrate aminotransferase-like enzyme/Ser/Thr protein kinase RdoA (MazF antagonist)
MDRKEVGRSRVMAFLQEEYGLLGSVSRLPGENENYDVTRKDGGRFVLKVIADGDALTTISLEDAAMEAVRAGCPTLALPRIVRSRTGKLATPILGDEDATPHMARLMEFVDGAFWFDSLPLSSEARRDLGRQIAQIDLALSALDLAVAHRTHRWDLARAGQHRSKTGLIEDTKRRRMVEEAFLLWSAGAEQFLKELPHSIIHGDLNDENLRIMDGRLHGVLDFGDCLFNPTICELAIALAYLLLEQDQALAMGADIVCGYHEIRPLSVRELEVLFPLICGRLAASVVISAERRQIDPDRAAWFATEERAWRALASYMQMRPVQASRQLAGHTGVQVFADVGESPDVLLGKRRKHFAGALALSYREPVKFMRGRGQYLFDEHGQPYLDLYNNVCHVGHCHPRVVAAASRQMARLNTNTRYLYDVLYEYAERLCATLPPPLQYCFFVNSGSEANELALRLARAHTGRNDVLVLEHAYHGHTNTLIGISPYKFMGPGGAGKPGAGVHVAPLPDGYRGKHKGQERATGVAYGRELASIVRSMEAPLAAFMAETLPSCAGQIIPPPGFFETAFEAVRGAGGVCILDEVQVGFGRLGTHFWAFESQGVVPDIVVMGKPIGNGHPLGAVVTSRAIARSFSETGMEFFSTFGGNPVSCAVGLAVLDVIRDEGLQAHALEVGRVLLDGLQELKERHPIIGDVRGRGLFIGIELVSNRDTLQPATAQAQQMVNALRGQRILTNTDGPFNNVIKIKPPMVLSADDARMAVACMDEILGEIPGPAR